MVGKPQPFTAFAELNPSLPDGRATSPRRLGRILLRIVATCIALVVLLPWPHPGRELSCNPPLWELPHDFVAYVYALQLEDGWRPAQPRSRAELERELHLYVTKDIAPSQSCWGRNHRLEPGERMLQYQILWHAPLDVVYDPAGQVRAIFTSYE